MSNAMSASPAQAGKGRTARGARLRTCIRIALWSAAFVATLWTVLSLGASPLWVILAIWAALAVASGLAVVVGAAIDRRARSHHGDLTPRQR